IGEETDGMTSPKVTCCSGRDVNRSFIYAEVEVESSRSSCSDKANMKAAHKTPSCAESITTTRE
ncbi:hypothetical protein BGZ46_005227, partial [Entomortierella lignicola]